MTVDVDVDADAALHEGLVVAAHGRHAVVEAESGERVHAHVRGKGRARDGESVVVGDRVQWRASGDGGVVEALLPRRNLLHRQDAWRSKSFAANVDRLLVLVAGDPMFGDEMLARALIAAAAAEIPAVVGLNKVDRPEADAARERLAPYRAMGTEVVELALKADPVGSRAALAPLLAGRVTLVIGPSGAGKSTLVNLVVPHAAAQTGEISRALGAGRHTTTATTWYWIDDVARDAALIDTPGFQAFGLHHVAAADLAALMPDYAAALGDCRFQKNCSHRHEPGCAVQTAIAAGAISPRRQRIYETLYDELSARR